VLNLINSIILFKKKALFAPFFDRKYLMIRGSMLKQIQQKIDPSEIEATILSFIPLNYNRFR